MTANSKPVFTEEAPAPVGPYSQAMIVQPAPLVFVSGCVPLDKQGKFDETLTIPEQAELCCKNAAAILEAAGSSLEKVVKTTVFLDDMANFAAVNGVYSQYFAHKPARSCVAVRTLPLNVKVEIECIATQNAQ